MKLQPLLEELELSGLNIELTGFDNTELTKININEEEEYQLQNDTIKEFKEGYKIIITIDDETEQQKLYNQLKDDYECRLITY